MGRGTRIGQTQTQPRNETAVCLAPQTRVFHLTTADSERVLSEGLMARPTRRNFPWAQPGVYVWTCVDDALAWAAEHHLGRTTHVVEIEAGGLLAFADQAVDLPGVQAWRLADDVPAERLRLVMVEQMPPELRPR